MIERDIDCRKHRKSTHLAAADLDGMTSEGKSLVFTIKDAWYETGVDVSGNKTDGYFCTLKEHDKPLVLNSINRAAISVIANNGGFKEVTAYNIGNWAGLIVELYVDRKVKMMGATVDGIRVKPKPISWDDLQDLFNLKKDKVKDNLIANAERIIEEKDANSYDKLHKHLTSL